MHGEIRKGAETVTAIFFVTVLVILSAIDIERRILPNVILLPATAVLLVAQVALFPERVRARGLGCGARSYCCFASPCIRTGWAWVT